MGGTLSSHATPMEFFLGGTTINCIVIIIDFNLCIHDEYVYVYPASISFASIHPDRQPFSHLS